MEIVHRQLTQVQKEGKMMMVSSNPKKHVDLLKIVGTGSEDTSSKQNPING